MAAPHGGCGGKASAHMNPVLLGILGYVVVQFAIGAYYSRRMASDRDYITAGRSLTLPLVAFSVFSTWFGAEAIVTSAGEVYSHGLAGGKVDPFGYAAAVVAVGLLLASRLWLTHATTFTDVIRQRFSPAAERLFVIVLLPGSIFWAAAQIRAFGQILSSTSSLDVNQAIVIAAVLVAVYAAVGGLLADAVTDVVQGVVVILGLAVLTALVVANLGGAGASLASVTPDRLIWFGADEGGAMAIAEKLTITICGSLVSVELISRFLGARSAAVARNGTIIGGVMYLVVGLMPLYIGLVGPNLIAGLAEPEQIVPRTAELLLPVGGYAIFAGALVSAILSVVHAALHAPAAQVSHNIVVRYLPDLGGRGRLTAVRLTVVALSLVALVLALRVERIRDLVEIASAIGSAGAVVVVAFGLFTRIGGSASATATLVTGGVVWAVAKFIFAVPAPYLLALAVSAAVYLVVARAEW